ncbi:MAG: hypothetical protein ABF245_05750 [Planktotalea arctica]
MRPRVRSGWFAKAGSEASFIRDLALGALDAACDRLSAERHGLHARCRPFIKPLIAEQVNIGQNRAHLDGDGPNR